MRISKIKVETKLGGTWHNPHVIEVWINNGKPSRSCNQDNLVQALRFCLVISS